MKFIVPAAIFLFLGCSMPERKKSFMITDVKSSYIKKVNQEGGYALYISSGLIKNMTDKTYNNYSLELEYKSFNDKNESFVRQSNTYGPFGILDDGFYGGFGRREKKAWAPDSTAPYSVSDHISKSELLYPTSKVLLIYRIKASDPFGNSVDEELLALDITEKWLEAATAFNPRNKNRQ